MDELNSNRYFNDKNLNTQKTYNIINTYKYDNSYNSSLQKDNLNTAYTTFNNLNQTNNLTSFDKYKNQQLLNRARTAYNTCNCSCHINSNTSQRCYLCHPHHFHIHHIHFPTRQLYDLFNKDNTTEIPNLNNSIANSNNLLKEVTELRNECKKFKEELDRNNREKNAGDNYIRELENELNSQKAGENNPEKNNFNKYHDMLDKSFGVLNSVSNKCNDEKGKMKGGVYYYMNKQPDYDQLIEAQKNWVENLPENNAMLPNVNNFNNSISKTYSINDQNPNEILDLNLDNDKSGLNNDNYYKNKLNDQIGGNNDDKYPNKYYFDSKKNNNKGYIIKRGDRIRNNDDGNDNDNENDNERYNDNQDNDFNNNRNNAFNDQQQNPNTLNSINYDLDKNNPYKNSMNKSIPKESINNNSNNNLNPNLINNNPNNENKNKFNNNVPNNNNEEEKNPINERYLIVDKNGNPILINGEKLLGMELIPLIGENGKEVIDENGNIVLVGPDGDPKTQEELEPIILDNDKPLVNEENKPFLGLLGVPLVNGEGSPILGPGELYDNENKRVEGVLGVVAKDKNGNPIKVNINEIDDDINKNNKMNANNNNDRSGIKNPNLNNNGTNMNIQENPDEKKPENFNNYKNLRPLIGPDGIPLKDSNNQHILLDEKNIPVKNTGISLLLDQSGKPLLNSLGAPILLDKNGNPINIDNNPENLKISLKKPLLNKNGNLLPQREQIRSDGYNIAPLNNIQLKNKGKNNRNKKRSERINYSECNPESLKKINFMRPYINPFYDDIEYKSSCFACDVGCSVSKSGYSPMSFSPYNNIIRRRDITPIGRNIRKSKKSKKSIKRNLQRIDMGNDNNYYLTGE